MDFFELLQNENQLTSSMVSEISSFQQLFSSFSQILDPLLFDFKYPTEASNALLKSLPQTPMLGPYLSTYYLERLDSLIFTVYLPRASSLTQTSPSQYLEYLREIYQANRGFLIDFNALWGSETTEFLINTLKQRFQVLFIKQNDFKNVLLSLFSAELTTFHAHMLNQFSSKLDPAFIAKVQALIDSQPAKTQQDPRLFELISQFSLEFGFLDDLSGILMSLLTDRMARFLKNEIAEGLEFENNETLSHTVQYSQCFLHTFLQNLGVLFSKSTVFSDLLNVLVQKLEVAISENFFLICKDRLFDMILAYPDSARLIFDLKAAISTNSTFLFELSDSLLTAIQRRLLIPGVITQSILNQYINILKVLQLLDKGLIFAKVTAPIKAYLLKRPDTLRCIIAHLTEDSENYTKLVKEYVKIPSKEEQQYELSSDEDELQAEKWEVLPLLSKKNSLIRVKYQESDLVSVLVNLYGSQEAFINEYQVMLAEKLLGSKEFNLEEEIKNIELLKVRFGENNLQNCNIIVKDVKESKRIDQNLHANFDMATRSRYPTEAFGFEKLHAMFASKGYWPINYDCQETLKLPVVMQGVFDEYAVKFSKVKAMRRLQWHSQLGFVNLSLSFDNGEFEFKCLPIHAVLISYFDEASTAVVFSR